MTRISQLLHPQRVPVATRAAATLLLLRDSPEGLEVLMTRRSSSASFAPGAQVFPGGGVDEADAAAHPQALRRAGHSDSDLTHAIAAIRESFEELGVLLARRSDGTPATQGDVAALNRSLPFVAQCRDLGLTLATDETFLLARWITDRNRAQRFDVPFLVARMPADQTPVADETEQFEPVWVRPTQALDRLESGEFSMMFPTIRTLAHLKNYANVQAVLQACAVSEQPLWTSSSRAGWLAGQEARYTEDESPYGELALVCPDGQIRHTLDWQSEKPVALLKNLMRLTAPNPGMMTGPGTNSYLVGDSDCGYIAIDPGPADAEHLERLWQAAGGDIRMIVCTHSHPDHSPGAKPLQALCLAAGRAAPPIWGLASAATARAASEFKPDRELLDQQILSLQNHNVSHSLQVIYTPGHAANHLCLVLMEDALLFSGDHVLNGSTTLVDPPDGNMNDYLNSLDRLSQACLEHQIEFILPAHGYVIGQAGAAIAALKTHRLKREAKIARVMQAQPGGTLDDWVQAAYDDVPQRLWPVATRSLLAHVQRLQSLQTLVAS